MYCIIFVVPHCQTSTYGTVLSLLFFFILPLLTIVYKYYFSLCFQTWELTRNLWKEPNLYHFVQKILMTIWAFMGIVVLCIVYAVLYHGITNLEKKLDFNFLT